jgi:hypothetical protein
LNAIDPNKARLLAENRIRWHLGLGDQSWLGWLTVLGYAIAALLAGRSALTARRASAVWDERFWWAACLLLLLLGVNKQLDLQVLLTDIGRAWAVDHGWYRARRAFQKEFISGVALCGAAVVAAGVIWARKRSGAIRLGFAGLVFLIAYILIRAASFHHMDSLLRASILGLRWTWIVEWAGIATVGIAAWRYRPD